MKSYKTFLLSDEPKIFGLPITVGIPVFILTGIGVAIGQAPTLFIIGAIISAVMYQFFGALPIRWFYGFVYWKLPKEFTRLLFRRSPDSSIRIYIR